jgi:hypothetical protein
MIREGYLNSGFKFEDCDKFSDLLQNEFIEFY